MKFILKIKPKNPSKKRRIIVWIQKKSELNDDILQFFQMFKENIQISKLSKLLRYYIVTSKNPAIILNLLTSIQESIPQVYFNKEIRIDVEDLIDKLSDSK